MAKKQPNKQLSNCIINVVHPRKTIPKNTIFSMAQMLGLLRLPHYIIYPYIYIYIPVQSELFYSPGILFNLPAAICFAVHHVQATPEATRVRSDTESPCLGTERYAKHQMIIYDNNLSRTGTFSGACGYFIMIIIYIICQMIIICQELELFTIWLFNIAMENHHF